MDLWKKAKGDVDADIYDKEHDISGRKEAMWRDYHRYHSLLDDVKRAGILGSVFGKKAWTLEEGTHTRYTAGDVREMKAEMKGLEAKYGAAIRDARSMSELIERSIM